MSGVNIHVPLEFRTRVLHGGSKKGRNIGPAVIGVNSPGEAGAGAMPERFPWADTASSWPDRALNMVSTAADR